MGGEEKQMLGPLEVGAGVYIKGASECRFEEEVVLLDGTKLLVDEVEEVQRGRPHHHITAKVDLQATREYFAIFDNHSN
jgi:hypothetical protein